jgi:hypothetical protein
MSIKSLSKSCPCCGLPMHTVAMGCPSCEVKIEGTFGETFFDKLSSENQCLLEQYLLAGFSIKALEQTSTHGYAALRSRLDALIADYKALKTMDAQKKAILKQLETSEITIGEAKRKLKKLGE